MFVDVVLVASVSAEERRPENREWRVEMELRGDAAAGGGAGSECLKRGIAEIVWGCGSR